MNSSLADLAMRRYPEKREMFEAFKECQGKAMANGAMALGAGGASIFGLSWAISKFAHPLLYKYIAPATLVGACLVGSFTSWTSSRSCIRGVHERTLAQKQEQQTLIQQQQQQQDSSNESGRKNSISNNMMEFYSGDNGDDDFHADTNQSSTQSWLSP